MLAHALFWWASVRWATVRTRHRLYYLLALRALYDREFGLFTPKALKTLHWNFSQVLNFLFSFFFSTYKQDCRAHITIGTTDDGRQFKVSKLCEEHNHPVDRVC